MSPTLLATNLHVRGIVADGSALKLSLIKRRGGP
jgi:hypothetical protein